MRILKLVLLATGILISLALIIALFVEKNYTVEREITINRSQQDVFNYIKYLKNQDNYSKWAMMDPAMKKTYRGTDGNVGFVSAWESEKKDVGSGEQEIKQIVEGRRVDFELRFFKPFESVSQAYMTTEAIADNQTKVTWGFNGQMSYPMNIMLLFMNFEKMIGDDFDTGLTNLKKLLEK